MTGEKRDYEIGKTLKRKRKNGEKRERKEEVKRWEGIGQNENA